MQPIFLLTISRSGSTLVQRVLAAHPEIQTVSEPWLLLPPVYSMRERGVIADYVHPLLVTALGDFCQGLPDGRAGYEAEIREFALRLYEKAAGPGASYFVDKSPYAPVAADIMRIFPDSPVVFLWRNPLAVIASLIETWEGGRWYPTMYRGDLFLGLPRLIEAYSAGAHRAHAVNFERLVSGDEAPWRELLEYLGLKFDPDSLRSFAGVKLAGRMGDPTGTHRYTSLSTEPLEKWRQSLANPVRVAWCRRYLHYLGEERLATMGYSLAALEGELASQPLGTHRLASDLRRGAVDVLKEPVRVRVRRMGLGGPNVIRELLRH